MITDDAEAQALMLEYDVLDQVSHRAYPDDTISSCVVEHHPTHWLLCSRFWGNPDPAENGLSDYQIISTELKKCELREKAQEGIERNAGQSRSESSA